MTLDGPKHPEDGIPPAETQAPLLGMQTGMNGETLSEATPDSAIQNTIGKTHMNVGETMPIGAAILDTEKNLDLPEFMKKDELNDLFFGELQKATAAIPPGIDDRFNRAAFMGIQNLFIHLMQHIPDTITSYEQIQGILPELIEGAMREIVIHPPNTLERFRILGATLFQTMGAALVQRFPGIWIDRTEMALYYRTLPATVAFDEQVFNDYIDNHREEMKAYAELQNNHDAQQLLVQSLLPDKVDPAIYAMHIRRMKADMKKMFQVCDEKNNIVYAKMREEVELIGTNLQRAYEHVFNQQGITITLPSNSTLTEREVAENEKPSITKQEILDLCEREYCSDKGVVSQLVRNLIIADLQSCPETVDSSNFDALAPLSRRCLEKKIRVSNLDADLSIRQILVRGHTTLNYQKPSAAELATGRAQEQRMQSIFAMLQERLGIQTVSRHDICTPILDMASADNVELRKVPIDFTGGDRAYYEGHTRVLASFLLEIIDAMPLQIDHLQAQLICSNVADFYAAKTHLIARTDQEAAKRFVSITAGMQGKLDVLMEEAFPATESEIPQPTLPKQFIIDTFLSVEERVLERLLSEGVLQIQQQDAYRRLSQTTLDIALQSCPETVSKHDYPSVAKLITFAFEMQFGAEVKSTALPDATKNVLLVRHPSINLTGTDSEKRNFAIMHEEIENMIADIQRSFQMEITAANNLGPIVDAIILTGRDHMEAGLIDLVRKALPFLPHTIDRYFLGTFCNRLKLIFAAANNDSTELQAHRVTIKEIDDLIDAIPGQLTWTIATEELESPSDFGLEGEGPFTRDEFREALVIQTKRIAMQSQLQFIDIMNERIDALCPEEITCMYDLNAFIPWMAGKFAASDINNATIQKNTWKIGQDDPRMQLYGAVMRRIGERFGHNGFGLDPATLSTVATHGDRVVSKQMILEIVGEVFQKDGLKNAIDSAAKIYKGKVHVVLRTDLRRHIESIYSITSDILDEWLPNGASSGAELIFVQIFLHSVLENTFLYFESHVPSFPREKFKNFVDTIINKRWKMKQNELQKYLGLIPDEINDEAAEISTEITSDFSLWFADTTLMHTIPDSFELRLAQAGGLQKEQLDQVIASIFKTIKEDKSRAIAGQLGVTPDTKGNLMAQLRRFRSNALAVIAELTEEEAILTLKSYQQLVGGIGYAISSIDGDNANTVKAYLAILLTDWFVAFEKRHTAVAVDDSGSDSLTSETQKDALAEAMETAGVGAEQAGTYIAKLMTGVVEETVTRNFRRIVHANNQGEVEMMSAEMTEFAVICTDVIERVIPFVVPAGSTPSIVQLNEVANRVQQEMSAVPANEAGLLSAEQRAQMIVDICEEFTNSNMDAADLFLEEPPVHPIAETRSSTPKFKKLVDATDQLIAQRTRSEERQKTQEARDAFPGIAAQLSIVQDDIQQRIALLMAQAEAGDPQAVEILRDFVAYQLYVSQSLQSRFPT